MRKVPPGSDAIRLSWCGKAANRRLLRLIMSVSTSQAESGWLSRFGVSVFHSTGVIVKRDMDESVSRAIDPAVRIGHVHLKVADLERALTFYCGVLGFEVTQRWGSQAAFLSAGGYHHHIALNTWESRGGPHPAPGSTGLYHLAILYPNRRELADVLRRVLRAGITLEGAADHGVSEALYLRDPDQNGVELYWDRPREHWPYDATGQLAMYSHPLDLRSLLGESPGMRDGTDETIPGSGPADL